jgi:hypothetical protein
VPYLMFSSIHSIPPWNVSVSIPLSPLCVEPQPSRRNRCFSRFPKHLGRPLHWERFVSTRHRGTSLIEKNCRHVPAPRRRYADVSAFRFNVSANRLYRGNESASLWVRSKAEAIRGTGQVIRSRIHFYGITGQMDHGKLRSMRHCSFLSGKPNRIEPRPPPPRRRSSYVLGFGKHTDRARRSCSDQGVDGAGSRLIELAGSRRSAIDAVMMADWRSVTGTIRGQLRGPVRGRVSGALGLAKRSC